MSKTIYVKATGNQADILKLITHVVTFYNPEFMSFEPAEDGSEDYRTRMDLHTRTNLNIGILLDYVTKSKATMITIDLVNEILP